MPTWLVLAKKLPGGAVAAVAINSALAGPASMTVSFEALGLPPRLKAQVHDVWTGDDVGVLRDEWRITNLAEETALFWVFQPL
jgi:hypothetical protein